MNNQNGRFCSKMIILLVSKLFLRLSKASILKNPTGNTPFNPDDCDLPFTSSINSSSGR